MPASNEEPDRGLSVQQNFVSLSEQAIKENHSHIRYLEALLALECEERDRHAIDNRIREAQLPRMKTLEEFDFAQVPQLPAAKLRELAEGGYTERSEPVLLIGVRYGGDGTPFSSGVPAETARGFTVAALVNDWWSPSRITKCGA